MMNDWATYQDWRQAFGAVMDPRLYTLEWLDRQIEDNVFRFTSAPDAALVTEVRIYPTGAFDLHFMVAAGNLDTLVNVLRPEAEAWAKCMGAIGAIVESREGWAKALKAVGYEPYQMTCRKDL